MDIAMEQVIRKAQTLIEALPYMQKLHGATVVIKYGGAAMANAELMDAVMDDVILLKCIGLNPILVHGGGPEISRELAGMGVPTRFVNGLRVTDERTMEVVQMALVGKTNKGIVSILNRKGAKAIGLCGVDGGLLECEKLEMEVDGEPVDLGYVGKVTKVDCKALDLIAKDAYIPVVAPIGAGKDGHAYNINADTAAAEIASAMRAEKLILLTDVDGVRAGPDAEEPLYVLTAAEVHDFIAKGVISKGMIPKALGCLAALDAGVGRTHIIDGRVPHCILLEIFTNRGIGTMILKSKVPYYMAERL